MFQTSFGACKNEAFLLQQTAKEPYFTAQLSNH
jgi:hypothetical protein